MYFIDVQGTLIDDKNSLPIASAVEFIEELNKKEVPYVVITNNTKQKSDKFLEFLNSLGFKIDKDSFIDPFLVLKESVSFKKIAAFGSEKFISILKEMGYEICQNFPEALFVAATDKYTNQDYAKMIEYLLEGCELVGMHATSIYAREGKRYPGCGAILQMLKYATGKDALIVGKPSVKFYEKALEKLRAKNVNINFSDVTIISDDAKGDLAGAKKLGMKCVFVLSGKYKNEKEGLSGLSKDEMPDIVIENIGELNEARRL